jgi:hypothetical protein
MGVKASRSNGLAAKTVTETKNTVTTEVTAATSGIRCAYRRGVTSCAAAANSDRTKAQNSRLPACPPYRAASL